MKAFKYVLIVVLAFVFVVAGYSSFERYILNDNLRGISPDHIVNICLFLILPISNGLFFLKRFGKKMKKKK